MGVEPTATSWLSRVTALRWTVKDSFVRYVQGSGGSVTVVAPASVLDTGITFPASGERGGLYRFAGGIVFSAHGGMLAVAIAEPAIADAGPDFVLSVADVRAPHSDDARRPIATLRLDSLEDTEATMTPSLTIAGSATFGMTYPEGFDMDPLTVTLARS